MRAIILARARHATFKYLVTTAPSNLWLRVIAAPSRPLLAAVVVLNLGLTLLVEFRTLKNFPNSGDEYSYFVSAELFARGRLSVPSPPHRDFFEFTHVVNDGKFYGKYPPGWPALLGVGVRLGVPWLVNPVIGALTLIAIWQLARRHFSVEIANTALLMCAANPFFVFNSASYFSHSSCLLFLTLFLHAVFSCIADPKDRRAWLLLGASSGAAFLIRPFTSVVFFLPCFAYLGFRILKDRRFDEVLRGAAIASVPLALCAALFFGYNRAQTGNFFVQPFQKYDPGDKPSLPRDGEDWSTRFQTHVANRLWQLNRWLPLSVLLLLVAAGTRALRQDPRIRTCLACFGAMFVAFFCYWGDGIVQYGPRYLYECFAPLLLVCAAVSVSFGRGGFLTVLGMFLLGVSTFVVSTDEVGREISANREVHRVAQDSGVTSGIIFVRNGFTTGPLWGSPGSVIDFDGPLLVVHHRGEQNAEFLRAFPGRKSYVYDFDRETWKGTLFPLEESR
jgi:hypothetical protein